MLILAGAKMLVLLFYSNTQPIALHFQNNSSFHSPIVLKMGLLNETSIATGPIPKAPVNKLALKPFCAFECVLGQNWPKSTPGPIPNGRLALKGHRHIRIGPRVGRPKCDQGRPKRAQPVLTHGANPMAPRRPTNSASLKTASLISAAKFLGRALDLASLG